MQTRHKDEMRIRKRNYDACEGEIRFSGGAAATCYSASHKEDMEMLLKFMHDLPA
jgi:hypothetical protein